jgi:hypothetical protein
MFSYEKKSSYNEIGQIMTTSNVVVFEKKNIPSSWNSSSSVISRKFKDRVRPLRNPFVDSDERVRDRVEEYRFSGDPNVSSSFNATIGIN